jgi:hypothetical protein
MTVDALPVIVGGNDGYDISALELAGQALRKALDGDRYGLFGTVEVVQIGIFRSGGIGQLGVEDIIADRKVGSGIFADDGIGLANHVVRQGISRPPLHGLHHICRDLVASLDLLDHADNFRFSLTALLNSGVTPKQMSSESRIQKTPTTVRFLNRFIGSSLLSS